MPSAFSAPDSSSLKYRLESCSLPHGEENVSIPHTAFNRKRRHCHATHNFCVNVWIQLRALQKVAMPTATEKEFTLPPLHPGAREKLMSSRSAIVLLKTWERDLSPNSYLDQICLWCFLLLSVCFLLLCPCSGGDRKARSGTISWMVWARKETGGLFQKSPALSAIAFS